MQIHVVQRGQSLYGISQAYGIAYEDIAKANEIPDPSRLVVGQALVIPVNGRYHFVQPGQSLYIISQMYGVSFNEIAKANGIATSSILQIGQRLKIPTKPKPTIEVLLYVEPRNPVSETMIKEVTNRIGSLTYLAMFSYQINRDGSLIPPQTDDIPNIARSKGATNALVVSNIENYQFSGDLIHAVLIDEKAQNQLIGNLIQIANDIGYKDIHFDFEFLKPEDREAYNDFLEKARDRFHRAGLTISTAVGPKATEVTTGIFGGHDYTTQGKIVDFVALMTYEWGYTYSAPQAVSPINQVKRVVDYAVSTIPSEKVVLGQNLYGYDWSTPFPPDGGVAAKAISPQQAIAIALKNNAEIQYDYRAQAPFFHYYDEKGVYHEVWFEDARSIQAKFDLIKQYGLRGIMYWKLGLSFPQNWLLLTDNFNIKKLPTTK